MEYKIFYSLGSDAILDIGDYRINFTPDGIPMGSKMFNAMQDETFFGVMKQAFELWEVYRMRHDFLKMFNHGGGVVMLRDDGSEIVTPRASSCDEIRYCEIGKKLLSQSIYPLDDLDKRIIRETIKSFRPNHGFVYLVRSISGHYKIGRSRDIEDRVRTFSVKLPFEVSLDHVIECDDYFAAETSLHRRYADKRVNGSEFFALTPADVTAIKSIERL